MATESGHRKVRLHHRIAIGESGEWFVGTLKRSGKEERAVFKRIERSSLTDGVADSRLGGEARLLRRVRHPGVLQVLDFVETKEHHFLAFEYVEGVDAQELIKQARSREKNIPIPSAVLIATAVAEALDYLHNLVDDKGKPLPVVVRNISPRSVLLSWDGRVKLYDLTTARHRMVEEPNVTMQVGGAYAYLSPEEVAGSQGDQRTDIFHLGVVLYELLTLRRCFGKRSLEETIRFVKEANYRPVEELRPKISPRLVEIIRCALSRDPQQRYESAAEMARALKGTLEDTGVKERADIDLKRVMRKILGPPARAVALETYVGEREAVPIPIDTDSELSSPDFRIDDTTREEIFKSAQVDAHPMRRPSARVDVSSLPKHPPSRPRGGPGALTITALAIFLFVAGFVAGHLLTPSDTAEAEETAALAASVPPPIPTAPPPTLEKAAETRLRVTSEPEGAEIFLDGRATGEKTPAELTVQPGVVLLSAVLEGKRSHVQRVELIAGEETLVSVPFVAPAAVRKGGLFLESEPPAEVLIAGKKVGETPLRKEGLQAGPTNVVLRSAEHGFMRILRLHIPKGETLHHSFVARKGTLNIQSQPRAQVMVGRTAIGVTPLKGVELYEGSYQLRLINREQGLKRQVRVIVRPDQVTNIDEILEPSAPEPPPPPTGGGEVEAAPPPPPPPPP